MNRFQHCKTQQELQEAYKAEMKRLHPDMGGDAAECAQAIEEHKAWREELIRQEERRTQRQKMMHTLGAIGSLLQDISEERDCTESIKKLVPKEQHNTVDMICKILKN